MTTAAGRRGIRDFLATILVGVLAIALTASELARGWGSRAARGTVREAVRLGSRAGVATDVVVEHEVAGRTVVASLRTWFYPNRIQRGEVVAIRYRPDAPTEAALDDFWQLHIGSTTACLLLAAVAFGESLARAERCRLNRIDTILSRGDRLI